MEHDEQKSDGRKGNGGARPGAGRKKGSGANAVNVMIRLPAEMRKDADEANIKISPLAVKAVAAELKKQKRGQSPDGTVAKAS